MTTAQISSCFLFLGILSCSGLQKNLSEEELLRQAKSEPLYIYGEALRLRKTDSLQSCHLFQNLSSKSKFLLAEEAKLRASEICPETMPLLNTDYWPKEMSETLEPFLNRIQISRSEKLEGDFQIIQLQKALRSFEEKKDRINFAEMTYRKCAAENEKCRAEVERVLFDLDPIRDMVVKETQPLKYAEALREQRRFKEAIDLLRQVINNKNSTPEDKSSAYKKLRTFYRLVDLAGTRKTNYLKASTDYHKWALAYFKKEKKDPVRYRIYLDATLLASRTLWTEDQFYQAQVMLTEAVQLLKGLISIEEVYFILARMAEEKQEYEKALSFYDLMDKEPITNLVSRARFDWPKSWLQVKLKMYEEAVASLSDLASKTKEPSEKFKAQFWQAYSLDKLERKDEAKALLTSVATEDILGYYGILANYKLGLYLPPLKYQNKKVEIENDAPLALRKAQLLSTAGDDEIAKAYIANFKRSPDFSKYEMQTYLLQAQSQQYLSFFAALSASSQETKKNILEKHPELIFPMDYAGFIISQSNKNNIDPALTFSIIRQESTFNPKAKSAAEAYGLMQLIPATAKKNAKKLKLPWTQVEQLYDPEYNITLGTYELSLLLKKFGTIIQLASGYNANENALKGWLKTRYNEDSLIFIEDVPYDETRSYIKFIIRNMVFYSRLNASSSIQVPASLFDLKPAL